MTDDGVLVHFRHARMIQRRGNRVLCRDGIEAWCARNGIDWKEFTGPGVPAAQFRAIHDPYAAKALRIAIEDASRGQ